MAFINYANEKISSYEEYQAEYDEKKAKEKKGEMTAVEEQHFAKKFRASFKKLLAKRFDIDVTDISISNGEKCTQCDICGGSYYNPSPSAIYDDIYRCNVCTELISEKRRMVTRIDGTVFMRHKVKGEIVISKYTVTRLGNLRMISSAKIRSFESEEDEAALEQAEEAQTEVEVVEEAAAPAVATQE